MIFLTTKLKNKCLLVIAYSFPKIVKKIIEPLPKNDYPVLNIRLFVSYWLGFTLDKSLTSMRNLFKRLNNTGYESDILTFSKPNLHRSQEPFIKIYKKTKYLLYDFF